MKKEDFVYFIFLFPAARKMEIVNARVYVLLSGFSSSRRLSKDVNSIMRLKLHLTYKKIFFKFTTQYLSVKHLVIIPRRRKF